MPEGRGHPHHHATDDIRLTHRAIVRPPEKAGVKIGRVETAAGGQLQLGLLLPRHANSLPPIAILAARAGWQAIWVAAGFARPNEALVAGMRVGWVVSDTDEQALDPVDDIWLRGGAATAASMAAFSSRLAGGQEVSVDAPTADVEAAIRSAGGVPVFGPAPLQTLVERLRGASGRSAVCLPASPGRTAAEAQARLSGDPGLRAEAEMAAGLVGTLEECQQTVATLYAAGMRELRLRLPETSDIPDVIAQMSTLRGALLADLLAGSPRSPAPAAPSTWGGRPSPRLD